MAKYSGTQFTNLLVDGFNIVSSLSEAVTMSKESLTQQTNAFGATSETHTPLNVEKGVLTVGGGFFDDAADLLFANPTVARAVNRVVCAGIEGNTIGKHFIGYEGAYDSKYEVQDIKDGLTKANLNILVSGNVDEGVILLNLAARTADLTPPTGDTPVDFTTDTVQGAQAITSNSVDAGATSTVTCPKPHDLVSGDIVLISGVITSNPTINGSRTATVLGPTTFTVPVDVTTPGTGGSFVKVNSHHGGVGYLQVTAYSGFTGAVFKVRHSPDDTTYATLITFTDLGAVTGPHKERKATATITTVVDRYLSGDLDVTGAGSVTAFMGFCRN